jgi:Tfp pilus assembly protein PilN
VAEIDLIPREYRRQRERESLLRRIGVVAGVLGAAGMIATGSLAWAASGAHAELRALELAHRLSDQQRIELENLERERARLEQQWARLEALRGGDDVEALFLLIERALPEGELWFDRWDLHRNDRGSDAAPAAASAAADAARGGGAQMRILGQARDHAALSQFVRSLYESPGVQDVHLERTGLRRYTTTSVVDFELAVELESEA